jgi:L-asparagine oxygenase
VVPQATEEKVKEGKSVTFGVPTHHVPAREAHVLAAAVAASGDFTSQDAHDLGALSRLKEAIPVPDGIRQALRQLLGGEMDTLIIATGRERNFAESDPTPSDWSEAHPEYRLNPFQRLVLRISAELGDVFGIEWERGGAVLSNIIPIPRLAEEENMTAGYRKNLGFHTEDSYLPSPADFLCLGCHRNEEGSPTWLSSVADIQASELDHSLLSSAVFTLKANSGVDDGNVGRWPVFSQYLGKESMRLSVYRNTAPQEEHNQALARVVEKLESKAAPALLAPGDILIFNNRRVAHGRSAYEALPDGRGRWLSRVRVRRPVEQRV